MFIAHFISDEFTVGQAARFIFFLLFGNLIGGSVSVGVLDDANMRHTLPADSDR